MCFHKMYAAAHNGVDISASELMIFVVDDHPMIRKGFRLLIENEPGLNCCGEASDGFEALDKLIDSGPPDLVITDISMKGMNGLELITSLKELWPKLPVLVSSTHEKEQYAEVAYSAGANGYVEKCDLADHAADAIWCTLKAYPCMDCPYYAKKT